MALRHFVTLTTAILALSVPAASAMAYGNTCTKNNGDRCYAGGGYQNWSYSQAIMQVMRPSAYVEHCAGGENTDGTIRGMNACTPLFGEYVFKNFDQPVNVKDFAVWHGGGGAQPITSTTP